MAEDLERSHPSANESGDDDSMVEVGVLGRPHGVQGGISFILHNPDSSILEALPRLFLDDGTELEVSSFRPGPGGRAIVTLGGVTDREQAAALTSRSVRVRRRDLADDEDGFYLADLIGMTVRDRDGRDLGRVSGVLPTGGVDVLEVEGALGGWMMPAAEQFIVDVDSEAELLVVDLPPGLVPGTGED